MSELRSRIAELEAELEELRAVPSAREVSYAAPLVLVS